MRAIIFYIATFILAGSTTSGASEPIKGRAEVNWRMGHERSILMTEFWAPFAQDEQSVLYGNYRMMGDDKDNREFNLGVGYREIVDAMALGRGVVGVHGWFDRRMTGRGSQFNQATVGAEWLGENIDILINGYAPLSDKNEVIVSNSNAQAELSGTGIFVDTNGVVLEEPQHGFDIEVGTELGRYSSFLKNHTDSFRVYAGGYYFNGPNTEDVAGWRGRFTMDITSDFEIGGRFQRDDERGSQGFLEATFRFPMGHKKRYRAEGLRARLDESPERDIDIVTGESIIDTGSRVPVINRATGSPQEVLHVDNTAAGGGDGSAENPFNALADAEVAASANSIIYVRRGDGTSSNMDQGITLNQTGQQLIGSGTNFVYDGMRFTTANGLSPSSTIIAPVTTAPVIGNVNAGQDGVTITADNVTIAGLTINNGGTGRDGIVVRADGAAASAQNVTIQDVTATNNRMGIYLHGTNSGAVSAMVQRSVTTGNSQHGIAVYDDTDGTFEVDLGGGAMGSVGHKVLAGNTLEDLAVDYDGRTLAALNNWWGQATGPDTDTPDIGIAPQIYYGAPINDGLVGHWTFDSEWTTNTTAYDRSGQGNNGTLQGGLSLADMVAGQNRQALDFGGTEFIELTPINVASSSQFSVMFFAKDDTVGSPCCQTVFAEGTPSDWPNNLFIIYYSENANGALRTWNRNSAASNADIDYAGQNFNDGVFHSISYTQNGNQRSLFADAIEVGQNNSTHTDPITSTSYIGANNDNGTMVQFFNGTIDDVRVFNTNIDQSAIDQLYRMDTSSTVNTGGFLTSAP